MAVARVLSGWLHFRQLDHGHSVDGAFAIGYRFLDRDHREELWSRRFLRVKDGVPASRNAARAVLGMAIPVLLDALSLNGESVTFTPAVRSSETTASESGTLSVLARHCAAQSSSEFSPKLLSKRRHASLHMPRKSLDQRIEILEEANFQAGDVTTENVFVVDDLITSGITLSYSARAIKKQNPQAKVYGLAPGKHEYWNEYDPNFQGSPNSHIPPAWNQLWYKFDKR